MAGYLRFIKFSGYLSNQTKRKEYVPFVPPVFFSVRPQIISRWVVLLAATFSGIGYSWVSYILLPLADCVKSALTLIPGSSLIGRTVDRLRTCAQSTDKIVNGVWVQFPSAGCILQRPEQTGNVATSYARKLFIAREAHCERLSYILKQCAQTLANSLLLGIINLCSSFCRHNTVLTRARGFLFMFLAPFTFPARVCGEPQRSTALQRNRALLLLEICSFKLIER